jgi:hypothetical protein
MTKRVITSDDQNKVRELASRGLSKAAIARETGVSLSTIKRMLGPAAKAAIVQDDVTIESAEDDGKSYVSDGRANEFLRSVGLKGPVDEEQASEVEPDDGGYDEDDEPGPEPQKPVRREFTDIERELINKTFGAKPKQLQQKSSPEPKPSNITMTVEHAQPAALPKPVAPVQSPQQELEHLRAAITWECDTFGPVLKSVMLPDQMSFLKAVKKMGLAEARHTLSLIKTTRAIANLSGFMNRLMLIGASAVEMAGPYLMLQTQGYTAALARQDQDIKMCLQEYLYDHPEYVGNSSRSP